MHTPLLARAMATSPHAPAHHSHPPAAATSISAALPATAAVAAISTDAAALPTSLSPPLGLNTTRLAFAVTKLLALFRLTSLGTHPTAPHVVWLPTAVGGLQLNTPAFGYTALDGAAGLAAAAPLWAGVEVETVVVGPSSPAPPLPPFLGDANDTAAAAVAVSAAASGGADIPNPPLAYPRLGALLYWPPTAPSPDRLRAVAAAAKAGGVAYLLVGSYPRGPPGGGVAFERGRWVGVPAGEVDDGGGGGNGARRHTSSAFEWGMGVRGVVPMARGGGWQRYLVLYRVAAMEL